jgi:hypothetical protein
MANIENAIQRIAHNFVQEIVKALVSSSIEEFAQLAGRKGARRPATTEKAAPAAKTPARRGRPAKADKADKAPKSKGRKAEPDSKRNRRSSDEIATLTTKVINFIQNSAKDHPEGVSVSEIAKSIKADIEDITRPIHRAVTEGLITKEGEKRLTRYFPPKG